MARKLLFDCDTLSNLKGDSSMHRRLRESGGEYYVCEVQLREIFENVTGGSPISDQIIAIMTDMGLQAVEPETHGWDDSWGRASWGGAEGEYYQELLESHPDPDDEARADARGAETALARGMIFVTADQGLQDAVRDVAPEQLLTEEEFRKQLE